MRNTNYLSKVLKLKEYIIEKVEDKGKEMYVYCHSGRRGMWFKNQYSKKVCETKIKKISHMMISRGNPCPGV